MRGVRQSGTKRIHRCAECGHKDGDHGTPWMGGDRPRAGGWCSMGGCSCRLSPKDVREANPSTQVATYVDRWSG